MVFGMRMRRNIRAVNPQGEHTQGGLSKWMTCAKVRPVAQTLLRLGGLVNVVTPSLILLAYI